MHTFTAKSIPSISDARDLINGGKNSGPGWAGGKSIGTLVADHKQGFYHALRYA